MEREYSIVLAESEGVLGMIIALLDLGLEGRGVPFEGGLDGDFSGVLEGGEWDEEYFVGGVVEAILAMA